MTSLAPARRLGLKAGLLRPGYPADLTVLSVDEETVIRRDRMRSRSHNTPFDGRRVRGRTNLTIVEGETRYEYRKII
jgi:dihydroorotase